MTNLFSSFSDKNTLGVSRILDFIFNKFSKLNTEGDFIRYHKSRAKRYHALHTTGVALSLAKPYHARSAKTRSALSL